MDFELDIGGQKVAARLPLMPRRVLLRDRYYMAAGAEGDGAAWDFGLVCAAALAVVWAGEPLGCPDLRACGWDVPKLGELAMDALMAQGIHESEVIRAGYAVMQRVIESIPTQQQVEEAADPTEAPAATSTETTS